MRIVIIFENGKLLRSSVEGTEYVSQEDDKYLWNGLISRGIGMAF